MSIQFVISKFAELKEQTALAVILLFYYLYPLPYLQNGYLNSYILETIRIFREEKMGNIVQFRVIQSENL